MQNMGNSCRIPKLRLDSAEKEAARSCKISEKSSWNFARFCAILLGQLPCVVACPEGVDLFLVMQPLAVELQMIAEVSVQNGSAGVAVQGWIVTSYLITFLIGTLFSLGSAVDTAACLFGRTANALSCSIAPLHISKAENIRSSTYSFFSWNNSFGGRNVAVLFPCYLGHKLFFSVNLVDSNFTLYFIIF
jgi:hypothetical protein